MYDCMPLETTMTAVNGLGLAVLPSGCLSAICKNLSVQDALSVSQCCQSLSSISKDEVIWEKFVQDWIDYQDVRSGILGMSAAALRQSLGLSTYHAAFRALFKLKHWPAGLWYGDSGSSGLEGSLLEIIHSGNKLALHFKNSPPFSLKAGNLKGGILVIKEAIISDGSEKVTVTMEEIHHYASRCVTLTIADPMLEITFYNVGNNIESSDGPGVFGSISEPESWFGCMKFFRPPLPLCPSVLPNNPVIQLLATLQGPYEAIYATHGREMLHVTIGTEAAEERGNHARHEVPGEGYCLQGLKLKGDHNVSGGHLSFCVYPYSCRMGRYDPEVDDPFPLDGEPREVLSFVNGLPMVVDMEERACIARYPHAFGQINAFPVDWDPQWIRVTLVVYDKAADGPTFSVIFEDRGGSTRHIIDFSPYREIEFLDPFLPASST